MESITTVADAAYQDILAYIRQHGSDANSLQAQLIIANLKTAIIAAGGIPPGAIQDPQQAPTADLRDEVVQEGGNGGSGAEAGVSGESRAGSGAASNTTVVQTGEDLASRTGRSASSQSETTATSTSSTTGVDPDVQASTTAVQTTRAAHSAPGQSSASSASSPTNTPSNTSGSSAASSSNSTTTTASASSASAGTNTRPTATSGSSANEVTQVYSETGCSETRFVHDSAPSAFTGFQFENYRSFNVANKLCKWLDDKAGPCANVRREFRIRTYDDHLGPPYAEPRFKIEPTASLKELAKVIKQKNVAIGRSFLEEIKWLVDYRCELTKRYLLVPTVRDSDLDKENRKHQFFNKAIREVYEILLALPRT